MPGLGTIAKQGVGAITALAALSKSDEAEAGIFGQLAKKAPMDKMFKAREMLESGEDAQKVFTETGWFRDPVDNQMKWEISDSPATISERQISRLAAGDRMMLSDLIHHPEFYDNYPDLANAFVSRTKSGSNDVRGSFRERQPGLYEIKLNPDRKPDEILSTGLHEATHGVQNIEGFSGGGNPEMFDSTISESYNERIKSLNLAIDIKKRQLSDIKRQFQNVTDPIEKQRLRDQWKSIKGDADRYTKHLGSFLEKASSSDPYNHYKRLWGEGEARNVQYRRKYPESYKVLPEYTSDISPDDAFRNPGDSPIVKKNKHGRAMYDKGAGLGTIAAFAAPGATAAEAYGEMLPPEYPSMLKAGQFLNKFDTVIGNPVEGIANLLEYYGQQGFDTVNRYSEVQKRDLPGLYKKVGLAALDAI